jgi:hypothetical protein
MEFWITQKIKGILNYISTMGVCVGGVRGKSFGERLIERIMEGEER